jgi:hypothetical protein
MMLKSMIIESRNKQVFMQEKMERVLKLMFNTFVAAGISLPSSKTLADGNNKVITFSLRAI